MMQVCGNKKHGGHFVTADSLRRVLHELKPAAVLCQPESAESALDAKPADCPLQVLGSAESVADAQQLLMRSAQELRADNTAPAVALLSSGTTGHPKIIPIPRRTLALSMRLLARSDALFGDGDILLSTTGFSWITGTLFTLWSIDTGMKFTVTPEFSPQTVLDHIERSEPTVMFMPPNQWLSLLRHAPEAGAALKAEAHAWIEARTGRPLIQWYGQTEAFYLCMALNRRPPVPPGSVGRVNDGVQAKVLDLETGKCLGPGVDGELFFKGWAIMEEFVDKEGWIHTGDVGHYDADGNFYVVDRVKELVKYRGVHVSPSELEAWLLGHPQVSEAVVVGLPHDEDQEHPAAFVVLAQGATVTTDELWQLVKEKARGSEEKLLHGGVFLVDSIPRMATGKVSRGQLRHSLLERIKGRA
ncbi:uncharacterized protein LOC126462148 [Schistocerca serialis cubense]|uniref:uncharacterized protein LOC126462148 n=1 Tax=Schistocerca serialis cubense TaxID=2023355 RepID=UPI00214F5FE2|nr:uncharacterized protein LOC126462148 [Schistocerca serialis cubense]